MRIFRDFLRGFIYEGMTGPGLQRTDSFGSGHAPPRHGAGAAPVGSAADDRGLPGGVTAAAG